MTEAPESTGQTPETTPAPSLSPGFDRARRLSRALVVALTVCLVLGVIGLIAFTIYMLSPDFQELVARHTTHHLPGKGKYAFALIAAIPYGLALIYARKLFARFAAGEVFTAETIGILRTAAMWLTISGFLPFQPLTLIAGVATYVAAYVMVEACRLADDSASIV
ncbi:MAG: hypothetical protein LCH56_15380 [Proteobacteria bacterium]|nr:hypothetical protein [Pseudomonadota bacterium]